MDTEENLKASHNVENNTKWARTCQIVVERLGSSDVDIRTECSSARPYAESTLNEVVVKKTSC